MTPHYNEPRYNEDLVKTYEQHFKARQNYSKIYKTHYNELILTVPTHNLPRYNEYFVLSLAVSKNDMMIQIVDKSNTSPIARDRHTLTFKALLYLNVAVHAYVYGLFFCVVYVPLFSLVQLGYPTMTNSFFVSQIFRYNGVFAITKTPL